MNGGGERANPLFSPLRPWLARLPAHPDGAALQALLAEQPLYNAEGLPLRFVPPRDDGLPYETRIAERGEVETRPDNWHDFFNALVWLAFPRAKAALSAAHARAQGPLGAPRGPARDALTQFDECGLLVISSRPDLLELLRDFQWRALFVERRAEVAAHMRFVLFGHASYEQMLAPFRGLTAKAALYAVSDDWLALPAEAQRAELDAHLAGAFAAGWPARPHELQPVPLLGLPGATPDNETPAYYDDTWQFRPGRRATTQKTPIFTVDRQIGAKTISQRA